MSSELLTTYLLATIALFGLMMVWLLRDGPLGQECRAYMTQYPSCNVQVAQVDPEAKPGKPVFIFARQ